MKAASSASFQVFTTRGESDSEDQKERGETAHCCGHGPHAEELGLRAKPRQNQGGHAKKKETQHTWPKKQEGATPEKLKRDKGRRGVGPMGPITSSSSGRESKSVDQAATSRPNQQV